MPVIFSTRTSHRVFMLDKDAEFMLKAMQTSGIIPGAMFPEAVPDALEALQNKLKVEIESEETENTEDNSNVGKNTKAFPLIDLLELAIKNNEKLLWDKG